MNQLCRQPEKAVREDQSLHYSLPSCKEIKPNEPLLKEQREGKRMKQNNQKRTLAK